MPYITTNKLRPPEKTPSAAYFSPDNMKPRAWRISVKVCERAVPDSEQAMRLRHTARKGVELSCQRSGVYKNFDVLIARGHPFHTYH